MSSLTSAAVVAVFALASALLCAIPVFRLAYIFATKQDASKMEIVSIVVQFVGLCGFVVAFWTVLKPLLL